jgi:hypothetical protein
MRSICAVGGGSPQSYRDLPPDHDDDLRPTRLLVLDECVR